jgi:hypothetical protein
MHLAPDPATSEAQPRYEVPHAYVYILLRRDLPPRYPLIQAAHVAFEAALRRPELFDINNEHWFVVCELADLAALNEAARYLGETEIPFHPFFEPDINGGEYTALCTGERSKAERKPLKRFRLWAD